MVWEQVIWGIFGWEGERRDRGRGFWRNGRFFVVFLIIFFVLSSAHTHTHTHSCPLILANSPHLFFGGKLSHFLKSCKNPE